MKNNKYVGKLTITLTMILVSMFAVVTATFAWFDIVNTPEVGNISMGADEGNEVLFSLDGNTWSQSITGAQIYKELGMTGSEKLSNVTPTATANGFTPTFTSLKYTPANSGSNGQSPVTAAGYFSLAATKNSDYLEVTIHVKSGVASDLYLYDLYTTLASQTSANEAARNMVRIGFRTSENGEMSIFNPSELRTADVYAKSGMGYGAFFEESNILEHFKSLPGTNGLSSKLTNGLSYNETHNFLTDGTKKVSVNVTTPNVANATLVESIPQTVAAKDALGKTVYLPNGEVYYVTNDDTAQADQTPRLKWERLTEVTYISSQYPTTVDKVESVDTCKAASPALVWCNGLYIKQASVSSTDGTVSYSYKSASYSYYKLNGEHIDSAINKSYASTLAQIESVNQQPTVTNKEAATKIVSTTQSGSDYTATFYMTIWFEGWSGYSTDSAELGQFSIGMRFIGEPTA